MQHGFRLWKSVLFYYVKMKLSVTCFLLSPPDRLFYLVIVQDMIFFSNSEFFVNFSWVIGLCLEDGFLNALSCWLFGYEGGLFFSFYFLFSGGGKIAWEIFRGHQNLKMFLLIVLWQVVSISTDSIDFYIWMLMLSSGFG